MLTIPLTRRIKGANLLSIVYASMQECGAEWECIRKDAGVAPALGYVLVRLEEHDALSDLVIGPSFDVSYRENLAGFATSAYFDMFKRKKEEKNAVVCMLRDSNIDNRDAVHSLREKKISAIFFAPLTLGITLLFYYLNNREKPHPTKFVIKDSIFAIINPSASYTELQIYANAALDFSHPSSTGRVCSKESEQFRKVEKVFETLTQGILSYTGMYR